MKKVLSLLLVSLTINTASLECMQRGRSGPSSGELKQARRGAECQADFLSTCPRWGNYMPRNRTLICLLMICLLVSQTQPVAALLNTPLQDGEHQDHTYGLIPAAHHYVSEGGLTWLNRLNQEAWEAAFQPPPQHHSIEEFIGGIVRCAREEGEDAVIAFLEEAEEWGFAIDSVFYDEDTNGNACLDLRHLIALNDLDETTGDAAEKLHRSITNIRSIVGQHDVQSQVFNPGGACFTNGG